MATKHYKKPSPKQPVYVNGAPIRFDQINIELGVYRTDDEGIQREFAALQQRGVGGIFDITPAEFDALVQKKTMNSHQPYRDEFWQARHPEKTHRPDNDLVYRAEDSNAVEPNATALPGTAQPAAPPEAPAKRPAPRKRAQQ